MATNFFQKGNEIGKETRFSSENQPKKRGRKPKLYKKLKTLLGNNGYELEEDDLVNIMRTLMETSPEKLKSLLIDSDGNKRTDIDSWVWMLVKHINTCVKTGRIDALEFVMDRAFGKAKQQLEGEITTGGSSVDLSVLSDDELIQYAMLQEKIQKGKAAKEQADKDQNTPGEPGKGDQ